MNNKKTSFKKNIDYFSNKNNFSDNPVFNKIFNIL